MFKRSSYRSGLMLLGAACLLLPISGRDLAVGAAAKPATRPATTRRVPNKPRIDTADAFFTQGPLPRLHITIAPDQIKALNANPRSPVHASIRESAPGRPDVVYPNVGIHLKGGPGSFRKLDEKPAFTVTFDQFVPGGSFHGLEKVHLNNSVQDPAYMCEYLGSYLFRASGCPAPRVTNGRVWLNGRDLGAVVIKEGFNDVFFKKFFKSRDGNLYEGSFADVDSDLPVHPGRRYGKKMGPPTREEARRQAEQAAADRKRWTEKLRELAAAAREPDAVRRAARLEAVLDVDRFLTFLACESILEHWDGYGGNRNNYRIYDDPRSGKLVFLPQGMDQLFQRADYPLFGAGALVARAVIQSPAERQRYFDRIAQIRRHAFAPESILPELERVSLRIKPLMEELGPGAARQHQQQTADLRRRILERIANIDKQLAHPPKPLKFDANGMVKLSGWEPRPFEGDAAAETIKEDGRPRLKLSCKSAGSVISWRTTLMLPQGRYTLEGRVKTIGVKAGKAPNFGAGLRISGEKDRPTHLTGSHDWQAVKYDFEVGDALAEVVLVCELRGDSGTVLFDADSLALRKR